MKIQYKKLALIGSFVILVLVFFISVVTVYITFTYPQEIIDRIQPLVPTTTPNPIKMKGIAVIGDSQSDEYRADDNRGDNYPSATKNWVEIVSQVRKVNFGPWGSWGEPRRTGYEYNWARTGSTVSSMIDNETPVGIAEEIKKGKVNVVVIFIGAIDFAPYFTADGYESIYDGSLSEPAKKRKINRVIADVKTAVYTLKDAGDIRILLVKIPDWGNHPGVQIAFPFPDQRAEVSQVITTANQELEKLADQEDLALLDPNILYNTLQKDKNGKVVVGNVTLERLLLTNNPRNFYLNDGVHYGTVINGLLANAIIEKLNTMISNPIKLLREDEITSVAGL